MTNHSLPIIARALGYESTHTTQIYSRLTQDPVRNAMNLAIAQIHLLAQDKEAAYAVEVDVHDSFAALKKVPYETMRDYFEISLYTGARKSNVLAMRWEDVDLDLAIWRIPITKNKESHLVPLTGPAVEILRRRLESNKTGWVFPGRMKDCHLVEPKRVWYKLVEDAGLEDLRMHDLRRTLASYMAITNHSLPIIAKALGHKSTQATQIYSRLTQDPVRQAMDVAIAQIHQLAQAEKVEDVLLIEVHDPCS